MELTHFRIIQPLQLVFVLNKCDVYLKINDILDVLPQLKSCKCPKESGICPIIPFRLYQWQEIRSEKCGKYVE